MTDDEIRAALERAENAPPVFSSRVRHKDDHEYIAATRVDVPNLARELLETRAVVRAMMQAFWAYRESDRFWVGIPNGHPILSAWSALTEKVKEQG